MGEKRGLEVLGGGHFQVSSSQRSCTLTKQMVAPCQTYGQEGGAVGEIWRRLWASPWHFWTPEVKDELTFGMQKKKKWTRKRTPRCAGYYSLADPLAVEHGERPQLLAAFPQILQSFVSANTHTSMCTPKRISKTTIEHVERALLSLST